MEDKKHIYDATVKGVMKWAEHELEHVGRIASVEDPDLQYSYAQSTIYGMAHLKDALAQLVGEVDHVDKKRDLLRTHDKVIRVMKHLIKEYDIDLEPIKAFNIKHVLSNLNYLNDEPISKMPALEGGKRKTRRRKNVKKSKMSRRK
jgi:hypothetical protein